MEGSLAELVREADHGDGDGGGGSVVSVWWESVGNDGEIGQNP